MIENEQLLRDIPLLARLSKGDLRAIASRGRLRSYAAEQMIFAEAAPGDSLHIVIEGEVRISVLSPDGVEATVALLGPGEFVGDLALLDGRPRSASAITTGPTRTLVVRRDDFRRWLTERPSAALALLEALSLRVRRTDEALADLSFFALPRRLAKRLLALAADHGEAQLRITQPQLASMLGVTRESVNKQLNEFARRGWVKLGRGSVSLLDSQALRSV